MSKFADAMSILGDAGIDYFRVMQNPARAARLAAAVDDGPEAVVDLANAMLRGGRPATPPAPAGRDPMPFEDRIANEPKIRAGLEEAGVPTEGMSQQDMLAEYTRQVMGAAPPRGRPRQAAPGQPPLGGKIPGRTPEDEIRALIPPPQPVRQFELPFGEEPTGLIPYGVRGPGVPQGGLMGPGTLFDSGSRGLIPAPLRGLPEPEPTGLSVIGERGLVRAPMRGLPEPEPTGLIVRDMPPARTPDLDMPSRLPDDPPPARPRIGPKTKAAAAAAAIGAGAAALAPRRLGDESDLVSGGEADLAAESRPAPSVEATPDLPEPTVARGPGYREQAHALQRQLNEMRMAARGEVPQAAAMKREIQRLFDLADAETNSAVRQGNAPAPSGSSPLDQARKILAALNAGTIPPARRAQAQAEMQRLYRMADEQANARTTARRAG